MRKIIDHILQRVLVNSFYRANTGFFLFSFFALFGIVTPGQIIGYHLSLIQGMIQSAVFLGCVIFLWFLYTLKCISHTGKQFKESENTFLLVLNKLSPGKQFLYLLWVHVKIYAPVLSYALIVAVIALRQHFYGAMSVVLISNIGMILLAAGIYRCYLQKQAFPSVTIFSRIRYSFPKPLFLIPLWFLIKERKQMLIVTKVFTIVVLSIFMSLYEPEGKDIRALLLILMLAGSAHCIMIFQMRSFEEVYLAFTRNLPVKNIQRFGSLLLLYILLLLPELLFIWRGFPVFFRLADYPQIVLLTISFPVFLHSILLMEDLDTESYLRIVFITAAALFFLILYDPGIALPAHIISKRTMLQR